MKRALLLPFMAFSFLAGCAGDQPSVQPSVTSNTLAAGIVGGSPITNSKSTISPATALIVFTNGAQASTCTGVLVARNLLLTAAHCFLPAGASPRTGSDWRKFVVFGSPLALKTTAWQAKAQEITDVVVHPQYNATTNAHDIAVVRLNKVFGTPVAILKTPTPIAAEFTLAGYGRTTLTGADATDGNVFALKYMTTKLALKAAPEAPQAQALVTSNAMTPAEGDSGGPAFVTLKGIRYVWGLDSFRADRFPNQEFYTVLSKELTFLQLASKQLSVSF